MKVQKGVIKRKKGNKFKKKVGYMETDQQKQTTYETSGNSVVTTKRKKMRDLRQPLLKRREGEKWYEYQVNEKISDPLKDIGTVELLSLEEAGDFLRLVAVGYEKGYS